MEQSDRSEGDSIASANLGRAFANVAKTGANATRYARSADSNEAGFSPQAVCLRLKIASLQSSGGKEL